MRPFRRIKRRRWELQSRSVAHSEIASNYDDLEMSEGESPGEAAYYESVFESFRTRLRLDAGRTLEIGIGKGSLFRRIRERSRAEAFGIDLSLGNLRAARSSGLVAQSPAERLPFASSSFSSVICNGVLEHLIDEAAGVREMVRVLAPGGRLFILTDNTIWQCLAEAQNLFLPTRLRYERFQQPIDDDFTPWRLRRMVEAQGVKTIDEGGMGPLPLLIGALASKRILIGTRPILRRLAKLIWIVGEKINPER